jgi:RES domain
MIVFRQTDARYPFLWESDAQPAGRWHARGDGPAHYFADTPDGAWAEFLRHEEITDLEDLATIRRQMWAVEIGDSRPERVGLPQDVLTGGFETYPRCQAEARRLRERGARRIAAPSAALRRGGARGCMVANGVHEAESRDGAVIVLFGPPADLIGWVAAEAARPPDDLLDRVHHFHSS